MLYNDRDISSFIFTNHFCEHFCLWHENLSRITFFQLKPETLGLSLSCLSGSYFSLKSIAKLVQFSVFNELSSECCQNFKKLRHSFLERDILVVPLFFCDVKIVLFPLLWYPISLPIVFCYCYNITDRIH